MPSSVLVHLRFREDFFDNISAVENLQNFVAQPAAGNLRITRVRPGAMMADDAHDTQMMDPQPVNQEPLESEAFQRDLNMQVVEGLHRFNAKLDTLHTQISTLPNDLAILLRSRPEDPLVSQPTERS